MGEIYIKERLDGVGGRGIELCKIKTAMNMAHHMCMVDGREDCFI